MSASCTLVVLGCWSIFCYTDCMGLEMLTCLEGFAGRANLVSACSSSISLYPPVTVLFRFKHCKSSSDLVGTFGGASVRISA